LGTPITEVEDMEEKLDLAEEMHLYCGKCGREMSASIMEVDDNGVVKIAYYCDACDRLMAVAEIISERRYEKG